MRIVKHGTAPGDHKLKAKCPNCGTVIEFMQAEAEYVSDQRDGDYLRIKCPVCPRDITKAVPTCRMYS